MKIGITLNDYFKDYLTKVAEKNNCSVTRVCGLILENYLSYNKNKQVIPFFAPSVSVVLIKDKKPVVLSGEDVIEKDSLKLTQEEIDDIFDQAEALQVDSED